MSELPAPETDTPSEIDHGELFRKSARHLAPPPMRPTDRKLLWRAFVAAATAVALIAVLR